jgi:hypothetical protein
MRLQLRRQMDFEDWLGEMAERCPRCDAPKMDVHVYAGGAEFMCREGRCGYAEELEYDAPREETVRY